MIKTATTASLLSLFFEDLNIIKLYFDEKFGYAINKNAAIRFPREVIPQLNRPVERVFSDLQALFLTPQNGIALDLDDIRLPLSRATLPHRDGTMPNGIAFCNAFYGRAHLEKVQMTMETLGGTWRYSQESPLSVGYFASEDVVIAVMPMKLRTEVACCPE
ncbi:MAG: hypothetical protein WC291_00550 [Thermodesulfovibrionales bacterium]|jgi:hypothetical protein